MPGVSIVMAVYDGRAYLAATMRSVLAQTYTDFEFIIIDDGSTDGVTDDLRAYAAADERVKLISRPNKGLTISLNEGLRLATAPLVARMDSDDLATPDRLAKQVAFMNAHPETVLLGGAYELIDSQGRLLTTRRQPTDNATLQQNCLKGTTPVCHPLAMFRREAALDVGGYDETYTVAQDIDFWLRLGEVGEIRCLPDVILQYRMHATSISEKKQGLQVANMKRACEAAWKRRGLSGSFAGAGGWRAENDVTSKLAQTLKYGWWAWNSQQRATARAYGWSAVRTKPMGREGWKLLAFSLLMPLPPVRAAR